MKSWFRRNAFGMGLCLMGGGGLFGVAVPAAMEFSNQYALETYRNEDSAPKTAYVENNEDILATDSAQQMVFDKIAGATLGSFVDPHNRLNRYMAYAGMGTILVGLPLSIWGYRRKRRDERREYYGY